ncbi:MAG: potassium-transporting ATPase subunit KdpC [Bacteriovorax sp.]|nr:potassium-transporting ATPase subunit KdpC [Bacteriovorax sp.]
MKILINNLKIFLFFIVLTGIAYPLFITVISQAIFKDEANGSLITKNGKVVGSELLAQEFKRKQYFWPRPSAANYDSTSSAASNLSPDSKALNETIAKRAVANGLDIKSNDDLLYASGSGLDPHISPISAERQIDRIAEARHLDARKIEELKKLIVDNTESRQFGVLGRKRINVLKLNLELDKKL